MRWPPPLARVHVPKCHGPANRRRCHSRRSRRRVFLEICRWWHWQAHRGANPSSQVLAGLSCILVGLFCVYIRSLLTRQVLRQALYKLGVALVRQDGADGGGNDAAQVFREGAQLGDVRCMVNFASLQMRRASYSSVKVTSAGASSIKDKKRPENLACQKSPDIDAKETYCKTKRDLLIKDKKSVVEQRNVSERNVSEALAWLQTAAEKGCGAALLNIGLWHLGLNKETIYLDYLQRAARAGDVVALLLLAKEYASGARLVCERQRSHFVYIYM